MKYFAHFVLLTLMISCGKAEKEQQASTVAAAIPESGHETFIYTEGDSTYVMQKYFMVFLKKGPERDQDSLTAATIQEAHLAHLQQLYLDGKTCITGPFESDGDVLGVVVFNTPTLNEADSLANSDPAVRAGRLVVETHAWWAAKGSVLK
ncbi:MAG: hypothetical protein KDD04_07070 [Sinomicrobium sp.]|nr:hypothetical protein [Sinomicrobium sp.]